MKNSALYLEIYARAFTDYFVGRPSLSPDDTHRIDMAKAHAAVVARAGVRAVEDERLRLGLGLP